MAWKQYSPTQTSSEYLDSVIHNKIMSLFNREQNKENIKKKEDEANQLQAFLYSLKNYKLDDKGNIFKKQEYNSLINALSKITNKSNQTVLKNIFRVSGGMPFEAGMQALASALYEICGDGSNLNVTPQFFSFGQSKTNIKDIEIMSQPMQEILKSLGVKTKKYLTQELRKAKNEENKKIYLQSVDIKIDQMAQDNLVISTSIKDEFPSLARFAQLFINSSFTLKNYSAKKKYVELGRTNMFRIIMDYIPTLQIPLLQGGGDTSFTIALFNRFQNINPRPTRRPSPEADSKIETHFEHIRNIYELTGAGQKFTKGLSGDSDVGEIRNYINQGVDFLIWNEHNGSEILVKSTLGILANYFEGINAFSGHTRTYLSKQRLDLTK